MNFWTICALFLTVYSNFSLCYSAKIVFTDETSSTEATQSANETSKNETSVLDAYESSNGDEVVLASDTQPRTFGFLKEKKSYLESKFNYLLSKLWSPFAPVYIDVNQDPYPQSTVYYRNDRVEQKPSIFSPLTSLFKSSSPNSNYYNDYYGSQNDHYISKRSIESSPANQLQNPESDNYQVEGRTLHHIIPAFEQRMNYLMNRIFRPMLSSFGNFPHDGPPTTPTYFKKPKLQNPLEYQNNLDHDVSSHQFHYQSGSAPQVHFVDGVLPQFLKRIGAISNSGENSNSVVSNYLSHVLRRIQTPVIKQKHA